MAGVGLLTLVFDVTAEPLPLPCRASALLAWQRACACASVPAAMENQTARMASTASINGKNNSAPGPGRGSSGTPAPGLFGWWTPCPTTAGREGSGGGAGLASDDAEAPRPAGLPTPRNPSSRQSLDAPPLLLPAPLPSLALFMIVMMMGTRMRKICAHYGEVATRHVSRFRCGERTWRRLGAAAVGRPAVWTPGFRAACACTGGHASARLEGQTGQHASDEGAHDGDAVDKAAQAVRCQGNAGRWSEWDRPHAARLPAAPAWLPRQLDSGHAATLHPPSASARTPGSCSW